MVLYYSITITPSCARIEISFLRYELLDTSTSDKLQALIFLSYLLGGSLAANLARDNDFLAEITVLKSLNETLNLVSQTKPFSQL